MRPNPGLATLLLLLASCGDRQGGAAITQRPAGEEPPAALLAAELEPAAVGTSEARTAAIVRLEAQAAGPSDGSTDEASLRDARAALEARIRRYVDRE